VFTPALRLLLFCFTAARSIVIVPEPGALVAPPSIFPASAGCCGSAQRSALSPGNPQTARSPPAGSTSDPVPGELASSVYSPPGTRSSTSSKTPKSRLNAAQSSCVTPESCSTASEPSKSLLRQPFRAGLGRGLQLRPPLGVLFERHAQARSLAGPANSISTTSSPCEAATRSAALRISSKLTAIDPRCPLAAIFPVSP
jgi:hypothetical protein